MSDLTDLYQEIVLDHNRHPRHRGRLEHPTHQADGDNPLCGDRVHLDLEVDAEGVVRDVRFDGEGCAISTASASMLTDAVLGRPIAEAQALAQRFRTLLTTAAPAEATDLGELEAMLGVRAYPMRVKCATLAWHTLLQALAQRSGSAAMG
jgi:nitrogen fixation NifU-like protein